MIRAIEPSPSKQAAQRVKAWLASNAARRLEIASETGVNEKTIRLALGKKWDPRISTLERLEAAMPCDWQPKKKGRAA